MLAKQNYSIFFNFALKKLHEHGQSVPRKAAENSYRSIATNVIRSEMSKPGGDEGFMMGS
jgi:hypothetical protein